MDEEEGGCLGEHHEDEFTKIVLSWSLDDILNPHLFHNKVENIPLTFESEQQYFRSFVYPLLEETRFELASSMEIMHRAPFADIISFHESKSGENMVYDVTVGRWRNQCSELVKDDYHTLLGDLLLLVDGKPESLTDLKRVGRTWALALVKRNEDDSTSISVKASQPIEFQDGMFAFFVMNVTSQKRIWNSLHMHRNLKIIKEILYTDSMVKEKCNFCSFGYDSIVSQKVDGQLLFNLNESQRASVMAVLSKTQCCHISSVEQIWGPPGTGKTMTVSVLLFILMRMKHRTLACAPTNVAIVELASRVQRLVRESFKAKTASRDCLCSFGDLLLFGAKERLEVSTDIEEIYLEHRIKRLAECLGPVTGWKHCLRSMIDLLENCVLEYYNFIENESLKEKQLRHENEGKRTMLDIKSFIEFVQERFSSSAAPLRRCIITFCTHISRCFMGENNFQNMISLLNNLSSLESMLFRKNLVSEELEDLFNSKPLQDDSITSCISLLRDLQMSLTKIALPCFSNKYAIKQFCFERASLIFSTTSSSYKLHAVNMEPLNLVVLEEAAQLKEAESTIPLQLPGVKHAILIGDERQLHAIVKSNVCIESGFGRSLFDRLSSLGHSKHLLNVQYRMHPSISFFPNLKFYQNQILDAQNVLSKSYGKRYLSGPMFGSYSFINVVGGREEKDDDGKSQRNMVEVALVIKIVKNLFTAWKDSKKKLTIGVISPYAAQVVLIQEKLADKYEELDGFTVNVKSIDGFQGGEEDIIILSTVRSNTHGSVGFISSPQRINVALTRARHCLWILGNESTLTNSESIWKELVCDARSRHCLFDADADECLKMTILGAKKKLEQLDDLVNGNSVLFKHAKWKVLFSDNFRRTFGKLTGSRLKKQVLNLLLKLSSGWRPKNKSVDLCCENSSQILKQFKVEGFYVICTIDIIKEVNYTQVLKVWDILALEEIPKLTKRLDSIYSAYTDDYLNRCTEKCLEGKLEVPKSWPASQIIIRFRALSDCQDKSEVSVNPAAVRNHIENIKVSESLLLMKFYSLSCGVVSHLLSGKEVDLPMQVNDEQMDIILSRKNSFIIGRSGTGKTTILIMKLLQQEHRFRIVSDGLYEAKSCRIGDAEVYDDPEISKQSVLRQLFVTVSPNLCYAVKQNVSHLTSISSHGSSSADINLDNADISSELNDIPDTFINMPVNYYPLVITLQKFLMMLDGTSGSSFFEKFLEAREGSHGNRITSRSVALQSFIRLREVTFDRFSSLYWPRFNSNLTKKLDPSRVFTEIISHIKGGTWAVECSDGKLSYEDYRLLAESRTSTLSEQKRKIVYNLFQAYEKMKTERGEFDLGDFVNDIHLRLKNGNYNGDQIDFVYIDEVQDLSMRQISLFKHICHNVDEGFTFAGDTAQTIAKGIDFRFQDVRSLFYKEFLSTKTSGIQKKGLLSEISQLKENFRTHAGVLSLAQSVIDILYCYFAHSIDGLERETSHVSGEAPVLLESGNDENAIVTIFGGSRSGGEIVGFGAEQVILVRDDRAKNEIFQYVGKKALVLTILECKGLEFQDVLLYNFFGTSPLRDRWRVIYGFMEKRDWLDKELPQSFPGFNEARHSVLCSELKQLYVAITRTRQRLWICENKEELSKPMFDYWKVRGLVQVQQLNDSVAQAMRVESSSQEWRERGKKLFYENNFAMAKLCFERAGDTMWEKLAKASGLRVSAEQIRETNPDSYLGYLREAAGMFESIGKFESAALCYCDSGEYERAGKIYMHKCGNFDAAAECFTLAGCYSKAAESYAKGDQFSNCLSVCEKGKLFDLGMQYIEYWEEHINKNKELEEVEQEFLESCALNYHKHKDSKSMMKFVRAFCSMESKRIFLRSLGCLDELLLLEEESGNLLEAVELARSCGDLLKEADLLEMTGHLKEAARLLCWYVLFSSLWGNGNRGWPLKQFIQKEELCNKVRLLAKMDSDIMNELKILSHQHNSLHELEKDLCISQDNASLTGEILSVRKILDKHLHLKSSKYDWEDELPLDIHKHCKGKMFQNRVSVRTLAFYWNLWKKHVENIFLSIKSLENGESGGHADFCLYYFGVRKQCVNGNMVYLSVNNDAEWIKNTGNKDRDEKHIAFDGRELAFAIRSYWQSELLSVGIKVLETLNILSKSKSNCSVFHQSTSLLHIFDVSKFLLDFLHHSLTEPNKNKLQSFLNDSLNYFDFVFPLDWRKAVSEDLVSLRETDLSVSLLDEIILKNVDIEGDLTYWTIGRLMMIFLGSRTELKKESVTGLHWKPKWKSVVRSLKCTDSVAVPLKDALHHTFSADWKCTEYISPHSYVHLLDRLLFMSSSSGGILYTTKATFVEWFTYLPSTDATFPALQQTYSTKREGLEPIFLKIEYMLFNLGKVESWIRTSKINISYYLPLLALRLVMMLSLICLQVADCSKVLLSLLTGRRNIGYLLPTKFVFILIRRMSGNYLNLTPELVAEAFLSIEDPLLIVYSGDASTDIHAPSAVFVDLKKPKQEIMSELLPRKYTQSETSSKSVDAKTTPEVWTSNTLPNANMDINCTELRMNWKVLEEIFEAINENKGVELNRLSTAAMIKEEVDKNIGTLVTIIVHQKLRSGKDASKDARLVHHVNDNFKFLSVAFDKRQEEVGDLAPLENVESATKWVQSYRPNIDKFVNKYVRSQASKIKQTGNEASVVLENQSGCGNSQDGNKKGKENNKGKKSNKGKGKKK